MADWIADIMQTLGYGGVAFLMFLENIFPPIPSEVIMPLAGFTAATGGLSFAGVVIAGALGSIAGALFWYWIGYAFGTARLRRLVDLYGRWIGLSGRDIDQADAWFDKHGHKAVLIGRLVPAVRTLISVPAGLSQMPFWRFFAYSAAGTLLWTVLLAYAGFVLKQNWHVVGAYIDPISKIVVVAAVAAAVVFVLYRLWQVQRSR